MNEDEKPLHQIIWQRFMKAMGKPPSWDTDELEIIQAMTRNWVPLSRATLITVSVFLIIKEKLLEFLREGSIAGDQENICRKYQQY
jgi:hypothetical protein